MNPVSPGNFLTSSLWNGQVTAVGDFALTPPLFLGYQGTAQGIDSGTSLVSVNLDSEVLDSEGGHSTTTNPSRYTVQVAGTYLCVGNLAYLGNTSGIRCLVIAKNGVRQSFIQQSTSSYGGWAGTLTCLVPCAVGDYLELQTYQNSGASLNTDPTYQQNVSLSALWLSK